MWPRVWYWAGNPRRIFPTLGFRQQNRFHEERRAIVSSARDSENRRHEIIQLHILERWHFPASRKSRPVREENRPHGKVRVVVAVSSHMDLLVL